jgi:hypothetical protein
MRIMGGLPFSRGLVAGGRRRGQSGEASFRDGQARRRVASSCVKLCQASSSGGLTGWEQFCAISNSWRCVKGGARVRWLALPAASAACGAGGARAGILARISIFGKKGLRRRDEFRRSTLSECLDGPSSSLASRGHVRYCGLRRTVRGGRDG